MMSSSLGRAAYSLSAGLILLPVAGCLDMPSKNGCVTSADCLGANICVDNHCVANPDSGASVNGDAGDGGQRSDVSDGGGPDYVVVQFDQLSTRLFTDDGDWAPDDLKGQCPENMLVNGISATPFSHSPLLLAHSALCVPLAGPIDHASERTHGVPGGADDRGDTSTGDWDVSYVKLECGPFEVVTGVAQSPSLVLGTILCSVSASGAGSSNCVTLSVLHDMDVRMSTATGDWAIDFSKVECGPSYALKGISTGNPPGELHRVLCCPRVMTP
jgi:hypothetical protein